MPNTNEILTELVDKTVRAHSSVGSYVFPIRETECEKRCQSAIKTAEEQIDKELRKIQNKAWDAGYKRAAPFAMRIHWRKHEKNNRYRDVSKILKEAKEKTND